MRFAEDILLLRVQDFLSFSKGYNSENKKGGQSFFHRKLCLSVIYIFIKHHQDILKSIYRRTAGQTDRGMDGWVDSAMPLYVPLLNATIKCGFLFKHKR